MQIVSRRVTMSPCTVLRGSPGRHLTLMLRSNRRRIRSVRPDSSCVAVGRSRAGPKQLPTARLIERSTSPTYSGLHRCSPWVRSDSGCTCCVGSTHHELCSRGCLHTESSSDTDLESLRTPRLPCGRHLTEHVAACPQHSDPTAGYNSGH